MKKITITITDENSELQVEGSLTTVELIGYLRFFEKKVFVDAMQAPNLKETESK